jgi:transcriptional regulator with XRE-family HTH domain
MALRRRSLVRFLDATRMTEVCETPSSRANSRSVLPAAAKQIDRFLVVSGLAEIILGSFGSLTSLIIYCPAMKVNTLQYLSARISLLRSTRDLSQEAFGKLCGISQGYVSQLEKRTREDISPPIVKLICVEFGCTEAWLIAGEGTWSPETANPPYSELLQKNEDLKRWKEQLEGQIDRMKTDLRCAEIRKEKDDSTIADLTHMLRECQERNAKLEKKSVSSRAVTSPNP